MEILLDKCQHLSVFFLLFHALYLTFSPLLFPFLSFLLARLEADATLRHDEAFNTSGSPVRFLFLLIVVPSTEYHILFRHIVLPQGLFNRADFEHVGLSPPSGSLP